MVTGVTFYLQAWVIEKKGPVFLAMSTPINLIFTMITSVILLCEILTLGRYIYTYKDTYLTLIKSINQLIFHILIYTSISKLQDFRCGLADWRALQCIMGEEQRTKDDGYWKKLLTNNSSWSESMLSSESSSDN